MTRERACYGYVRKGSGSTEYLLRSIRSALYRHALESELQKTVRTGVLYAEDKSGEPIRLTTLLEGILKSVLATSLFPARFECELGDAALRFKDARALRLIRALTQQLGATLEIHREPQPEYLLWIPADRLHN